LRFGRHRFQRLRNAAAAAVVLSDASTAVRNALRRAGTVRAFASFWNFGHDYAALNEAG